MIPLALIERASSSSASSRNRVRGWYGLGSIRSMSICRGPEGVGLSAGAAAAADPPGAPACVAAGAAGSPEFTPPGATFGLCGSGSRMSAPSPRPKAFLGIGDYLLGQLCVPLSALAMYIIENNRFTKTRCFGEPYVPRNYALKYLRPKKTAQIRGYLPR